ncbi:bridge-like lipid transfer protein family member 3B isoform X2 [Physella acuta]|uniref:bridge-like lipid transfer protein family member 3B isoform X2 n=1 Tax=Physella acuta TaxID=109671 RepID=UPI0027DC74C3|nr:bridge-like lipid transfer protein family member 3B isoform X2 [Physella acuta]
MAALLKNQILKHLSKFTKNLSADKINLSTLKGEGELSNLELNEDILTQLLELPTWLRITKAVCNKVSVKIQWTSLKSQPIRLYLDEVIVETETCEQPRAPNNQSQQTSGGKYGFVDRVMDGIYVHVNSVVVKLHSHKFQASLQLSRVKVQSMSPTWVVPTDLRSTRIRDAARGEVLLFKEIEWQTTRIEATAVSAEEEDFLTPLRLIANQAKIRIVVKKRLIDSTIISSRLTFLLDDLLWVLTITQLKAAILYANSLEEVIERSAQQSKRLAAEKLKKQGHMPESGSFHQQQQRSTPDRQESTSAKLFSRFDVYSTSYHLITSRFDLHLCDDSSPAKEETRHWKINGGSMQITFNKLSIDFYPFHPAEINDLESGERKQWHRYSDNSGSRNHWVNKLFAEFREDAVKLRKIVESSPMHTSTSAPSLQATQPSPSTSPSTANKKTLSPSSSQSVNSSPVHTNQTLKNGSRSAQASPSHQAPASRSTRLLESCFVVKVFDMTVYMVSMPGVKRTGPNKLLCSDRRHLHLPPEMAVLHMEFTDYFFPDGLEYPVPHSNMYVMVNPIRITLDFLTLLWSNVFLLTLSNSLKTEASNEKPSEHVDIKVQMLMPRIILPAEEKIDSQPDRPDAVQLQISQLVVSNCRMEDKMGREDLRSLLDQYKSARLFTQTDFPNDDSQLNHDLLVTGLLDHALDTDDPYIDKAVKQLLSHSVDTTKLSPTEANLLEHPRHLPYHKLSCNSLKRLASSDVWSATADQVWLEFLGIQNYKNRPAPFVEAIPVTFWLSRSSKKHDQNGVTQLSVCRCHRNSQTVACTAIREQCSPGNKAATVGPSAFSSTTCDNKDSPIDCESSLDSRHTSPSSEKLSRFDHSDHRHQDHDGNSSVHSHHEPDRHPTRLSLSGIPHYSNGSRHSKKLNRTESLHESDSADLSSSPHSFSTKSDTTLREMFSHEVSDPHNGDRRRGKKVEQYPGVYRPEADVSYQQTRQRQDKQKDCSRSSSSPPLGHGEVGGRRREESRERRSKERRIRHSSSSSIEGGGGGGGGKKNREADGRSSAEGQVSSDSFRSTDERKSVRDSKKVEDYYYTDDRAKPKGRDDEVSNLRRSRHSSSSSSEWGPVGSGRSRERRFQRSASRESRNFDRQDIEKHSPRERYNEERVSPRAERSPRDNRGRRSSRDPRDGSRESTDRRHEMLEAHVYERSPIRSKTRDIMDGFPLNQKGFPLDRDGGMSEDTRHRRRGVEPADPRQKHERVEDGDNQRFKYNHDNPEPRSWLSDSPRSRHNDADCDNDRFSPTSQSSQDMNALEVTQNMLNEQVDATLMKCTLPPETCKRLPPEGCKAQDDKICEHCSQQAPLPEKHLCLLTKIHGKLRVQLNHFQYLFLLRVSESFSAFQNDLSANLLSVASNTSTSKKNFKKAPVKEPPSVTVIPLILKELEFAVVCPYQMHQRTFSDDFSVISPFLQGFTGQDAVFGDDGDGTCFPQLVDTKGLRSRDDSSLRPFQQTISFKSNSSSQLENMAHLGPPADVNLRARGLVVGSNNIQPPSGVIVPVTSNPFSSKNKDQTDVMSQSLSSIGKDSGIGIERKSQRPQSKVNTGSNVGKVFSSAFSSFTANFKPKGDDIHGVGDDVETMSIRTDTSDDDFEHMSLDEADEVPAFFHDQPPPEVTQTGGDNYSDAGDIADSASMYAESSTTKGKEMVYVVLFKLDTTEILLQSCPEQADSKVQLAKLNSIQLGNISYEDFQTRFSTPKGYFQEDVADTQPPKYPIKLKFTSQSDPSRVCADSGKLLVRAENFSLQFKMSALTCLSDFSEDEKLPEAFPMSLDIRNLLLILEEDRPPANVTSPGSIPTNLHIQQMSIERGKDGIFYIAGSQNSPSLVPTPPPPAPRPELINTLTSPIMSPDGTMGLLMASQNETVLLRRQLEEVRRANRLYEHQILQWRDMQDQAAGGRPGMGGRGGPGVNTLRKRQSFTADSLSSSPVSLSHLDHAGQARSVRDEVDPARDELERENLRLQQLVTQLEDDLLTVSKEKESLLQTLQLLQEELLASERKQRARSKVV